MNIKNVVKNTLYVTSLEHVTQISEIYKNFFEILELAREVVGVKELSKTLL